MKPYYQDQWSEIYLADCREILPSLGRFDLLLTDPPYGLSADKKMARNKGQWGFTDHGFSDWDRVADQTALDTARSVCELQIIWGGNYFTLPPTPCWLVWNKMQRDFDFADAELAWTNLKKAVRIKDYSRGELVAEGKVHPTQKPLPLMVWCLGHVPDVKTLIDPYMGSGTTLVAAKMRGVKAIGIELEEKYVEIAIERLRQEILIPA